MSRLSLERHDSAQVLQLDLELRNLKLLLEDLEIASSQGILPVDLVTTVPLRLEVMH